MSSFKSDPSSETISDKEIEQKKQDAKLYECLEEQARAYFEQKETQIKKIQDEKLYACLEEQARAYFERKTQATMLKCSQ